MNQRSLIFCALLAGTFAPKAFCSKALNALVEAKQARRQAEEARKAEEARRPVENSDSSETSDDDWDEEEETFLASAAAYDSSLSAAATERQERLLREANAGRQESRARAGAEVSPVKKVTFQEEEQQVLKKVPPAPPLPVGSPESLKAGPMFKGVPPAPPLPVATGKTKQMQLGPPSSSSGESDDDSGPEYSVSINSMSTEDIMREIAALRREFQSAMKLFREGGSGAVGAAVGDAAAVPKKDKKGKPAPAGGVGDLAAFAAEQALAHAERVQASIKRLEEGLQAKQGAKKT